MADWDMETGDAFAIAADYGSMKDAPFSNSVIQDIHGTSCVKSFLMIFGTTRVTMSQPLHFEDWVLKI